MRSRVEVWQPYDLAASIVLATGSIFAVGLDAPLWIRVPVAGLSTLLLPGYALVSALFPQRHQPAPPADGKEREAGDSSGTPNPLARLAISLSLSIALVALVGLALNFTGLGIRAESMVGTLAVLTVVASLAALVRRSRLAPERRFVLAWTWGSDRPRSGLDVALGVLVAAAILFAGAAVAYSALTPRAEERFTEFYVFGSDGQAACLPVSFLKGRYQTPSRDHCQETPGNVSVGIANFEGRRMDYWVQAVWTNETRLGDGTTQVNNVSVWTAWQASLEPQPVDTEPGGRFEPQSETDLVLPPPPGPGLWRLSFHLFLEPPPEPTPDSLGSPYRRLHLWIEAGPPA